MRNLSIALMFVSNFASAQNHQVEKALSFYMEHYLNQIDDEIENPQGESTENETILDDLESSLKHYFSNPLRINNCTYLQLLEFPLISEQQAFHVLTYRKRYGDFRSLIELNLLPQFSDELIRLLLPFIDFSGEKKEVRRKPKVLVIGTSKFLLTNDSTDSDNIGSNVYQGFKFNVSDLLPGFSFAISSEKDRGESWFHPATGIEHVNYNVSYQKESGVIHQIIAGTYKASLGQGLVLHSGYNSFKNRFIHSGNSFSKWKVKPQNSNEESSFFKGVATCGQLSSLSICIFTSVNKFDATLNEDSTGQFFSSVGSSGMHRNQLELSKKDNVQVKDIGLSLGLERDNFNLSWNQLFTVLNTPFKRTDNYYNSEYLTGSQFYSQSLDFNYLWKQVSFFGELAADKEFDVAAIAGASSSIAEIINYRLLYRNYSRRFQSFRGKSYQQNGQLRNEQGLVVQVDGRLGSSYAYHGYYDFYLIPEMSYRRRFIGRGKEQGVKISYRNGEGFQCSAKVKFKEGQKNVEKDKSYKQVKEKRSSCRFNYRLQINENLRLGGQIEYSYYSSDSSKSTGLLLFQDIKHTVNRFTYGPRITLFSIDDYNARIYVYEPSLKFSSPFVFFKDKGFSFSTKLKYQIDEHFTMSIKCYYTLLQGEVQKMPQLIPRSGINIQCKVKF